MRKSIFFLAAVAMSGMFCACSSDDGVYAGYDSDDNPSLSAQVPIKLGVTATASVSTRGTGTVGGVTDANGDGNSWYGQTVHVYMFERGTLIPARDQVTGNIIYAAKAFWTPGSQASGVGIPNGTLVEGGVGGTIGQPGHKPTHSGVAYTVDGSVDYYPIVGHFDFIAYHIDDAGTGMNASGNYKAQFEKSADGTDSCYYVSVDINGTQDIMTANAIIPDSLYKDNTAAGGSKGEYYYLISQTVSPLDSNRVYSAHSARKGVQPDLRFKHHLTRLHFEIVAGNKKAAQQKSETYEDLAKQDTITGVYVERISVYSKHNGKLVVARTFNNGTADAKSIRTTSGELTFTGNYAKMDLMQRDLLSHEDSVLGVNVANKKLVPLQATIDAWDGADTDPQKATPLGEALLLAPDEEKYVMEIALAQVVLVNRGDTSQTPKDTVYNKRQFTTMANIKRTAKNDDGSLKKFEAGTSHKVTITIYGLEQIEVTTSLEAWKPGEDIESNPMEEEEDIDVPETDPAVTPTP